mmetsp:Transcript_40701/g.67283  ORF Transcript_40701/g.67283 Transcript_40701/m.67283 type:complete len:193 (+) Transcript_40701:93-671(+)
MFACCAGDTNQEPGDLIETKTLPVLQEKGIQSTEREDASGSFTVLVPAKRHATLGLELDTSGAHGPTVAEVKRGAVDDFNQLNPLRTIQPHDMVLQMGDAKGTEAILAKMAAPLRAKSSLGMKVILKEMCPGAVISEVNPTGLLGKWNAKNPSDAIAVSDRLLAVNGLTELKESLAEDLINETELELTFLKY